MARALRVAPVLIVLAVLVAAAQGDADSVRVRLERRFDILPIAGGVVLTPRFRTEVRSVEITDSTIAIDGNPVTGAELRKRLGDDADAVLQASYLDAAGRRTLGGVPAAPAAKQAVPAPPAPAPVPPVPEVQNDRPRTIRRDDIVRIGGSVEVRSDEHVTGDVVAIGGSARVDGRVDGEVVVIGGSLYLGPNAVIRNDVVAVGGGIQRDPGAVINGRMQEVGFDAIFGPTSGPGQAWARWNPMGAFFPFARFMGTLVRVGLLMLLAGLVILVARTPVEQIADRAAAEPVKAWVIGFLAEILFVPILVLTIVVLAISIIGIPLLLLVPVAIVAMMVVFLVGFTGVAFQVGRLLQGRFDSLSQRPYVTTLAGIVLILSPLIVARLLGLAGAGGFLGWLLVVGGFVAEYVAWTTGLGAAMLSRFSRSASDTMNMPATSGLQP